MCSEGRGCAARGAEGRERRWEAREAVGRRAGGHVEHGVVGRAAFGGVRGCDGVNYVLGFLLANFCIAMVVSFSSCLKDLTGWRGTPREKRRTFIVGHHVADVISPAVVRLAHAHRVVREVDVAVVAEN
jgi:hypothetical protein